MGAVTILQLLAIDLEYHLNSLHTSDTVSVSIDHAVIKKGIKLSSALSLTPYA